MAISVITPDEVIQYSALSDGFETGHIGNILALTERKLVREGFGLEFYNNLLDDLTNPYKDTEQAPEYNEGSSYATDDVVIFNDKLYISTADSNNATPNDETKWDGVKKFTTACNNTLWDLAKYWIANHVAAYALKGATYKTGGAGTVKQKPEDGGWGTVSLEELHSLKNEMLERSNDAFEELFYHLVQQTKTFKDTNEAEGCDFSYIDQVKRACDFGDERNLPRRRRTASVRSGIFREEKY